MNAKLLLGAMAAGAAVLGVVYVKNKAPGALGSALDAVNPLNKDNVFYTGVNNLGAAASGNPHFNLGAAAWELFNPGAVAAERAMLGSSPAWNAIDQEDADLGYSMDYARALSGPYLGYRR